VDLVTNHVAPTSSGFCVLVVCADPMMRAELEHMIATLAATPMAAFATSGLTAARLCQIARPEAVVLDVIDRGGDLDVLGISYASPSTAIVAFTAQADRRSMARLISAGAGAVVAKGDGANLHDTLSRLVSEKAA
jgi:AmiR/NasT family two-component response regulator